MANHHDGQGKMTEKASELSVNGTRMHISLCDFDKLLHLHARLKFHSGVPLSFRSTRLCGMVAEGAHIQPFR